MNIRSCAVAALALLLLMLLFSVSCGKLSSPSSSLAEELRGKMTETLPLPDGELVYWLRSGSVCHLSPDCSFIEGKEDIICSSFAESGKLSICKSCTRSASAAVTAVSE